MNSDAKHLMFGAVPNQSLVDELALADLKPVIDALERSDPDPLVGLPASALRTED